MGLDMYLSKRIYLSYQEQEALEQRGVAHADKVSYVIEDVGYWRKANAIHRWFVETVQGGRDDCRVYEVTREQLRDLLQRAEMVLERPELAPKLLPTQEGFFFGSTAYDEGYWADLEETRRILGQALLDERVSAFEYCASW